MLGFVPTPVTSDLDRWQAYLMERYDGVIQALRTAHSVEYPDFATVRVRVVGRPRTPDRRLESSWRRWGLECEELGLWRRFLAGRYPSLEALQAEYRAGLAGVIRECHCRLSRPDGGRLED